MNAGDLPAVLFMPLDALACAWWSTRSHPYVEPYACDDFACYVFEQLGLRPYLIGGSDVSEDRFALLVGWEATS